MKILATFDGTSYGESILPVLLQIAALPNASFTFLAVAHEPDGEFRRARRRRPVVAGDAWGNAVPLALSVQEPSFAEDKTQAIERRLSELEDYLAAVAARFPKGTDIHAESCVDDHISRVIIDRATELAPDVIVMATHSSGSLTRALFGSTTEEVVRSGIAPVLVVHPKKA